MKKYTTWLKTAAIFQFITAVIHAMTLFVTPPPNNDTEKQIFSLMQTYHFDFGAGFHRSMSELTLALSACFSLLCLFGGLVNWYLVKKQIEPEVMKGVVTINLIVFGICFALMAVYTFLPPILLTGLIVLFLVIARLFIAKVAANGNPGN
jgi:hypothetical protein